MTHLTAKHILRAGTWHEYQSSIFCIGLLRKLNSSLRLLHLFRRYFRSIAHCLVFKHCCCPPHSSSVVHCGAAVTTELEIWFIPERPKLPSLSTPKQLRRRKQNHQSPQLPFSCCGFLGLDQICMMERLAKFWQFIAKNWTNFHFSPVPSAVWSNSLELQLSQSYNMERFKLVIVFNCFGSASDSVIYGFNLKSVCM